MSRESELDDIRLELARLRTQVKALENYLCVQRSIPSKGPNGPSLAVIKEETARWFNLRPVVMCSRARDEHIVWPRQVAMVMAVEFCGLGCSSIGRAFNRDHAIVLHARRRLADRYATEPGVRTTVDGLRARILERIKA